MDTTTHTGTPLRQRMTEDMRMRKLEDKTQQAYIRAVRKLTFYLKRPPDTATVEDLRNLQLHLVDSGTSPITLNATTVAWPAVSSPEACPTPALRSVLIDALQRAWAGVRQPLTGA